MLSRILKASVLVAAVAVVPAKLNAQQAPAGEPAAEATAQSEIEQIQARLGELQKQALQDPALQAANQEVSALLVATMERLDPSYKANVARAASLKTDVAAAQEAKDNAKLHELAAEAQKLQASFTEAREKALEDEAVIAKTTELRDKLFAKMVEIDPAAEKLATRLQELQNPGAAAEKPAEAPQQP